MRVLHSPPLQRHRLIAARAQSPMAPKKKQDFSDGEEEGKGKKKTPAKKAKLTQDADPAMEADLASWQTVVKCLMYK